MSLGRQEVCLLVGLLAKALLNPLAILLTVLAAISIATGDIRAAVVTIPW